MLSRPDQKTPRLRAESYARPLRFAAVTDAMLPGESQPVSTARETFKVLGRFSLVIVSVIIMALALVWNMAKSMMF